MKRLIYVTGPQGCGKTINRAALASHFNADRVVDETSSRLERAVYREIVLHEPETLLVLTALPAHAVAKSKKFGFEDYERTVFDFQNLLDTKVVAGMLSPLEYEEKQKREEAAKKQHNVILVYGVPEEAPDSSQLMLRGLGAHCCIAQKGEPLSETMRRAIAVMDKWPEVDTLTLLVVTGATLISFFAIDAQLENRGGVSLQYVSYPKAIARAVESVYPEALEVIRGQPVVPAELNSPVEINVHVSGPLHLESAIDNILNAIKSNRPRGR